MATVASRSAGGAVNAVVSKTGTARWSNAARSWASLTDRLLRRRPAVLAPPPSEWTPDPGLSAPPVYRLSRSIARRRLARTPLAHAGGGARPGSGQLVARGSSHVQHAKPRRVTLFPLMDQTLVHQGPHPDEQV